MHPVDSVRMIATGIRPLLARIFEVKIWRRALERECFGFSAHYLGFARLCRTCGACEAGHVILRGTWTEAEPALDFREAHQAFIKRSFSKGSFLEVVLVSKIQDPRSTILPGRPSKTRKHSGCWILDVRKSCLLGVRARWILVPGCWI